MRLNQELTYQEVCQELQDKEIKSGRNRDLQLNRWNKLAEVEKVGRGKYIIHREFSQEEIQEKEYVKNYSKFLQNMLINIFAEHCGIVQTYTYRQLREYLSMVNSHYFPVKYGNESIDIIAPCTMRLDDEVGVIDETDKLELATQERYWFHQADNHDKDALHYALRVLQNRGLLVDFKFTYMFYNTVKDSDGNIIYNRPTVATDEQRAEIHQRIMEFLKARLEKWQIQEIEKKVESEREEDKDVKILSLYKKAVLGSNEKIRMEYGEIPKQYAREIGYDKYAKAITIIRPSRLESLIDTFAPKFNKVQVEEFLKSKRFKKADKLPAAIHIQLTDKLIKK